MSFSERLRAPDAYGLLLVALGAVAILAGVVGSFAVGRAALVALLSGTPLFSFRTSRVSMRAQRVALVGVLVAIVAVAVAVAVGSDRFASVVVGAVDAVLVFGALVAILRRVARHHLAITGTTVAGAACAYLLIGMFFASLYTVMAGASARSRSSPRRRWTGPSTSSLYFSFVTLTTVGYGISRRPASSRPDDRRERGPHRTALPRRGRGARGRQHRAGAPSIEAFLAGLLAASSLAIGAATRACSPRGRADARSDHGVRLRRPRSARSPTTSWRTRT